MEFKLETFSNPYLADGATRLDAVLTVTASGAGVGVGQGAVVGVIVDTSGSMEGERLMAARLGTTKAIELVDESSSFFVVSFADVARVVVPVGPATPERKRTAATAVKGLKANGGTQMSAGLRAALAEFKKVPDLIHKALFLTDGKNTEGDDALEKGIAACEGAFQCDCRGVGTDWQPKQLRAIAGKLLGTVAIIPEPAGIEADFAGLVRAAIAQSVRDVRLRLWTPKAVKIVAVKQVSPEIAVLTDRAATPEPQVRDYPTGAWGNEDRDYYVALELAAGDVGEEMLAARPSLAFTEGGQEHKVAGPPILASWTEDEALSARISREVAHYTGQAELAEAIQEGLAAREAGDEDAATRLLGKAAKIAHDSGNEETTQRLKKVVEVVDAAEGTVRLKKSVQKADEMDLDLGSTRTRRVRS